MTFPPVSLRHLRLDLRIRLRNVGLWPWLVFVAWALLARAQEPTMLRRFGIHIANTATWSGAAVVLAALTLASPPTRNIAIRHSVIVSVLLAWGVGLAQAAAALLLELVFSGEVLVEGSVRSAARFGFAWLPAVFLLVVIPPRSGLAATACQATTFVLCLWLAAPIWRHDLAVAAAISGLACAGSLLAAAVLSTHPKATESPRC